jgi:hypothetical protein
MSTDDLTGGTLGGQDLNSIVQQLLALQNGQVSSGANALTGSLLQNPDVLDQRMQDQILNQTKQQLAAKTGAEMQRGMGVLRAGGQMDAGSIAALQNRLNDQSTGALAGMTADLGVKAAETNRASELGVLGAANQNLATQSKIPLDIASLLNESMNRTAGLAGRGGGGGGGGGGNGQRIGGFSTMPAFSQWTFPESSVSPTAGGFFAGSGDSSDSSSPGDWSQYMSMSGNPASYDSEGAGFSGSSKWWNMSNP